MMTRYGLSMETVKLYTLEGSLPQVKGGKRERVLAMPVGEEADCFMAFNGKMFRQIGEGGISTVGQRRKDQICMVYENPLDLLTLMESATRNGAYPLMARRYHIIINGKRGLAEACKYLKANPDFLEVRCFMPENEFGIKAFAAINDAVKGTAIDRTDMYRGSVPSSQNIFRRFRKHTENGSPCESKLKRRRLAMSDKSSLSRSSTSRLFWAAKGRRLSTERREGSSYEV